MAVQVRAAVRNIDRALFSVTLQEKNLEASRLRFASLQAAPDRADVRDFTTAASDLLDAQDTYLQARRDVQVAILQYLLDSGQMRIDPDGRLRTLEGMELREDEPLDFGAPGIEPEAFTE